jgi:hypothetical protein
VVWQAEAWSMPAPESLPVPALGPRPFPSEFRYPEGAGPWGLVGQKRVWVRDTAALVAGEEPSPLVLAAIAADFASPLSHGGEGGLAFINGDVTLYLARYPVDDWIGFEVSGHVSAEGIAVGYCTLHDRQGTIGYSMASAVANQPMSAG